MLGSRSGLLVLVLSASSAVSAQPEPVINFKVRHYEVSGMTSAAITQSVLKNTPVKMNGGSYGAVTHNQFSTSYSAVADSHGGCEVKNVSIVLDSTVVLPKLVPSGQSAAVMAEWERYIGALRAHELMHANNGRLTAQTLASRLYDFKSQMPCVQMRARLDRAVKQLIDNMGVWDQQLDANTDHGRTQGAYLRPGFQ